MKRVGVLVLLATLGACKESRCEDITPAPIAGKYRGGGSLGGERMLRVGLEAQSQKVVLTYTAMDGSQIRATYKVVKKLKKK